MESQLRPVIHVTPFPGSSRAASAVVSSSYHCFPFARLLLFQGVLFSSSSFSFEYLGVAREPSIFALRLFILQQAELKPWFSRCPSPGVQV